jgi:hypothetical protein
MSLSYGLVVREIDHQHCNGVWEFAMAREQFIAIYAPQLISTFCGSAGELWRSSFVRSLGEIKIGLSTEEYSRYEPEYNKHFTKMYDNCHHSMVTTSTDITDSEALLVLNDFENMSERTGKAILENENGKKWQSILRNISIGERWWFFANKICDMVFTIFLAPESNMVSEVIERMPNIKRIDIVAKW